MKKWRMIAVLASLALFLLTISSGGCGPTSPTGGLDGSQGDSGAQQDGTASEGTSKDAGTTDTAPQDNGGTDTTAQDQGGTDTSTQDNGGNDTTTQDNGGVDTSTNDNGGADTSTQDSGGNDATTQDNGGTDTSTGDNGTSDGGIQCKAKGGYCDAGTDACRKGYDDGNDPLDCPGGRSARCCIPDTPPPMCSSDKDCPATCSGSGVCTQVLFVCKGGTCVKDSSVQQPNAKCDSATGQCVRLTPGCTGPCDCQQGYACVSGKCIAGTKPVYCCQNAGCPSGQTCVNKDGTSGKCPVATTDCAKANGYCTVQNTACRTGFKLDTSVSCGAVRSLQCCMPVTNKCLTVKCSGPTCAVNSAGACSQTSYACDPGTGKCLATTKIARVACKQSGTSCVQSKPSCSKNQCVATSTTIANSTCDAATGQCKKTSPRCTGPCDCPQGQLCSNGQCLTGVVPVYCCQQTGCPSGQKCVNKDGTSGTCPTSSSNACTLKKGVCVIQGQTCPKGYSLNTGTSCGTIRALRCCLPINKCATVKCSGPTCARSTNGGCTQTSHTCDPSTGLCVSKSSTSTPACKMNGTSCVQSTPVCSNNQCVSRSTTAVASCTQSGTSCIQVKPACGSSGLCAKTSSTIANSRCNTTTGLCATVAPTTCKAAGGTCINSRMACPRGTTANKKYTCNSLAEICCL